MAGYFLLDHRNSFKQYRATRRNGAAPSGVCVVHTAENATDFLGPDPGAEGVARFIAYRNDPGSYHVLADSDSAIQMAPWSYECWHDTRTNNHAVGFSAAISCRHWRALGDRGDAIVVRLAGKAREYADWLHAERGIVIPPRRITRAQALARVPGFIGHGEIDPGRRSDPGADFNWALFLAVFADASPVSTGTTAPTFTAPAPTGDLPDPLDPIDTLTKGTPMEIRVRRSDGLICHVDTGAGKFIALNATTNEWLAKLGVNLPAEFDGINAQQMALVRQAVLDINPDPVRVDDL